MFIKKAPPKENVKHVTANELTDDKNKRKKARYRVSTAKTFVKYKEGQYEQIFKSKTP